jgi:very-short-patch-repair endonuclease
LQGSPSAERERLGEGMENSNRARNMRNNPTDAEVVLWRALSARKVAGTRFNRQVEIEPYICDFVARTPKLIVEVDGGQHAVNAAEDLRRTRFLEAKGYRVIRFWNNDVLGNLAGVVSEIERVLAALPSPNPSRKREGDR